MNIHIFKVNSVENNFMYIGFKILRLLEKYIALKRNQEKYELEAKTLVYPNIRPYQ